MGIKAQFSQFSPGKRQPGGSAGSWALQGWDHPALRGWGLALTHRLSKSFPKRQRLKPKGFSFQTPGRPSSLLKPNMPRGTQVLPARGSVGISHLVDRLEAEDDADW